MKTLYRLYLPFGLCAGCCVVHTCLSRERVAQEQTRMLNVAARRRLSFGGESDPGALG